MEISHAQTDTHTPHLTSASRKIEMCAVLENISAYSLYIYINYTREVTKQPKNLSSVD